MEAALASFLAPLLTYLLRAGEQAAEAAGAELGGRGWEHAKALWHRLRPAVEARPAAREAVNDVAEAPENEDALAALRLQLKKLLAADDALAHDLAALWRKAEQAGAVTTTVTAGERGVAAGRDVSGTVITGDWSSSGG